MPFFDDRGKWTLFLFCLIENLRFDHRKIRPVSLALSINPGALHQLLNRINRFGAVVYGLMVLATHDDRFLRTSIDTKTAVNAAHHVDVESQRKFFDFGIRM